MAPPINPSLAKKSHSFVVDVIVPKSCARSHDCLNKNKKETNTKLVDLPFDLLANILEGLSSADRIRFGATCKTNLFLVTKKDVHRHRYEFRTIDKLPWLANFTSIGGSSGKPRLSFRLFDPCHQRGPQSYATYEIYDREGQAFHWGYRIKAARRGWFLCLWPKLDSKLSPGLISFLLFSPFNKRIIKLPYLAGSLDKENNVYDQYTCRATFSSDPTSPNCVYFFLSPRRVPGRVSISTLHQKTGVWKTMTFDKLIENVSCVVYHEGCFYCVSSYGQLAFYDVVQQSWEVIVRCPPLIKLNPKIYGAKVYSLVCEGKLLLAFVKIPSGDFDIDMVRCGLLEFSRSRRRWVERTSVGNHTLFLCEPTSFSVPVSSLSSRDDNIADVMYFYLASDQLSSMYYSFKDGQCHVCKDTGFWSNNVERGIWIEPCSPPEYA